MRFRRDTEVRTISDLADASLDELQQVWSVGPVIARKIKGSAQGTVKRHEQEMKEAREQSSNPERVAMFVGYPTDEHGEAQYRENVFDQTEHSGREMVSDALELAGVELDEESQLGYVSDNDPVADTLNRWAVTQDPVPIMEGFETPWREEDLVTAMPDSWAEIKADLEMWMYPALRTRKMAKWADRAVIVVDGPYSDNIRQTMERFDVECETVFEVMDDGTVKPWRDASQEEPDAYEPEEGETFAGGKHTSAIGPREGREADMNEDGLWRLEPNDADDARPDAQTGGSGAGKREDIDTLY